MKDISGNNIWLKELSQGKEHAFGQLFERYYTPLVIFADSYLKFAVILLKIRHKYNYGRGAVQILFNTQTNVHAA